jgi:2-methylisocitrate lyase-like PEP mutase family enzyme
MTSNIDAEVLQRANQRSKTLRELIKAPEILVMPGAYDTGSAMLFARMGFKAVQGSSGGVAAALGYLDGEVISRDEMVEVYRRMVEAVDVPVNADGEKGYGGPEDVAETVRRLIEVGAAGMNLEDSAHRQPGEAMRLIPLDEAKAKIQAFVDTRKAEQSEFFLNARVDAFMAIENPNEALNESIRRGNEYAALGADCVFYIRAGNSETIRTLVREVKAPVSILAGPTSPSVRELDELGVARVSYGTSFFTQALAGVKALADIVLAKGDPGDQLTKGFPHTQLNEFLRGKGG